MTRCDMAEVNIGDIVTLDDAGYLEPFNNYRGRDYQAGAEFRVTRVYATRMIVRHDGYMESYQVDRSRFNLTSGVTVGQRQLGTKPEDGDHLGIDDPRIQWIWDDLGAYADSKHWCPQYDELCRSIGIPGRPKDFHVTRTLNGIQVRAIIKARSQEEANQKFAQATGAPEEPTPTSAEFPLAG